MTNYFKVTSTTNPTGEFFFFNDAHPREVGVESAFDVARLTLLARRGVLSVWRRVSGPELGWVPPIGEIDPFRSIVAGLKAISE